ncbi:ABC transporter ATP-binding protein [Mycoplasmatota bacterium]|nr:ABC transporter ATP-binding protein [Mycoplasmatota bacterium]
MIKVKNVKKVYQTGVVETHALRDVSLEIQDGEFVVILGPSGSGKSTLLNVISGLDSVTSGEIEVDGEMITDMKDKTLTNFRRRKLGFIFQSYNLLSNLNVYENIEVGRNLSENPLSIDELLEKIGMTDQIDKYPYQLSGGQQQRVSIARALAKNPSILFCDEPTGALDEETGKQVLDVLQQLNKDLKTTIVIVTHNIAIKEIADKVIHMKSGEIYDLEINDNKKKALDISWS